jgi:chloramphenicol O-acetyltransferase
MNNYSDIEDEYNHDNIEDSTSCDIEVEEQNSDFVFNILEDIKNYKNENCINICEYINIVNLEEFISEI